jgi:hypothetical protein
VQLLVELVEVGLVVPEQVMPEQELVIMLHIIIIQEVDINVKHATIVVEINIEIHDVIRLRDYVLKSD